MPRIIGVDLGTTNSCVAALGRSGPTVLAAPEGERTTPSVVGFLGDGAVAVGVPARRQAVTNAERTVFASKRLIGRKVSSPELQRFAASAPYRIVAAPNGDAWVRLPPQAGGDGGAGEPQDVSPQEVSGYVLERMRRIAELGLGEPVTQAVITVPAYFDDAQRQATKDAGRLAGLDVRRILNEPTAAALAFGAHRVKERSRIAVFDLGGGTFDVSILSVDRGVFEVLSTHGDTALGGDDFDQRIVAWLLGRALEAHRVDLGSDPVALGRLREEAERAKKALSAERVVPIHLPFLGKRPSGEPISLEVELSRAELEGLTDDLIGRLAGPCDRALADAHLAPDALDAVLLVGGMTRMPAVHAAVERIFGRKPSKGANPDEIVALGAALHGGILAGEIEDVVLLDVASHSIGVRSGESGFSVVIPRNTTVPARARKLFATSRDDQPFVTVDIHQGESADARQNRKLASLTLADLPPGRAGTVRVEVTFAVDADGIVDVRARELSSGRTTGLTIHPSGGLSEADLERILGARRARGPRALS